MEAYLNKYVKKWQKSKKKDIKLGYVLIRIHADKHISDIY